MEKDSKNRPAFDLQHVIHELKHYLPAQAPLKDFIHHNTLHAFQKMKFFDGLRQASESLGYRVSLSLQEYRTLYENKQINSAVLDRLIVARYGAEFLPEWRDRVLVKKYTNTVSPRIGMLRANWKKIYRLDLDSMVHPTLFRILCSYLDQGVSIWNFPAVGNGFLDSVREMERNGFASFFRGGRAKNILLNQTYTLTDLLKIVVGREEFFERYLFDQQFGHQGWSGIVSVIEDQPQSLIDQKKITLHDLVFIELLFEIDALDFHFEKGWLPLGEKIGSLPNDLFEPAARTELHEVWELWQTAYEWSYYDQVLLGIKINQAKEVHQDNPSFQALFCIDDRECSFRRHLERFNPHCETYGTPGFFGVEFFYQPDQGKFYTKLCPAPVTPKFLIKEVGTRTKRGQEAHFTKRSHNLFQGWFISQTLGFWAAIKLFMNIFRPTMSPATASSFRHMDKFAQLTIENGNPNQRENELQIGFTIEEMVTRVENLLKSIGLVKNFASIVYVIGHGSSSVNNPHYAAYDCGACSGRAGSVNSRVICFMANHPQVRALLADKGLVIPEATQFVGGLHDTTRDDVVFFDEDSLSPVNLSVHQKNEAVFAQTLDFNAKERSRRFVSIDTHRSPEKIHAAVRTRSVSLFEPRPELNHATNALCIVGRRSLTRGLFLDRRAFMNSYNYQIDPDGRLLLNIIRPLGPVCGGINLEYFFSRVDNQKLGAGTKLPHNVMGLIGVANGIDGDLRPGLPSQMIEVHDPVRLLIVIEHFPEVVLAAIKKEAATYEWFNHEWVHLVSVNPETKMLYQFTNERFEEYTPVVQEIPTLGDFAHLIETNSGNISVGLISSLS